MSDLYKSYKNGKSSWISIFSNIYFELGLYISWEFYGIPFNQMLNSIFHKEISQTTISQQRHKTKRTVEVISQPCLRASQHCTFKVKLTPVQLLRKDQINEEMISFSQDEDSSQPAPPVHLQEFIPTKSSRHFGKKVSFIDTNKVVKSSMSTNRRVRTSISKNAGDLVFKAAEMINDQQQQISCNSSSEDLISQQKGIDKFMPIKRFVENLFTNFGKLIGKTQRDAMKLKSSIGSTPINIERIELEDNGVYQGCCIGNIREGKGKQTWPDGTIFLGDWKSNAIEGYGLIRFTNGDFYQGGWKNNRFQGKGTCYDAIKTCSYTGVWVDGQLSGKAWEDWGDGATFEGTYKNGNKHGPGKLVFNDGSYYQGNFADNQIHGQGKYCWVNSRTYEGMWQNNQMHGHGKLVYNNGSHYDGEFQNDKKHGYGTLVWEDNRKYQGYWENGKQHGHGVMYSASGDPKEGTWYEGKKISS